MESIYYDNIDYNMSTELCKIMKENGSDKGGSDNRHNYTIFYNYLFHDIKDAKLNVFELGLGSQNYIKFKSTMNVKYTPGGSIKGWKEYFKNSNIYGADIDKEILFNEDRIKTFFCDQTNPETIKNLLNNFDKNFLFDIIIDDGLHELQPNLIFLDNMINNLKPDGYYIIEDVVTNQITNYIQKLNEIKEGLNFKYEVIKLKPTNDKKSHLDNNLILISRMVY